MADVDRGPDVDQSALYSDAVMEAELRESMRSEGEIELFKIISRALSVRSELANSVVVKQMLGQMWSMVADFFEAVTEAPTLAGLPHDDPMVLLHQRMLANFTVVAGVNQTLIAAREAEQELRAVDDMEHEIEDTP